MFDQTRRPYKKGHTDQRMLDTSATFSDLWGPLYGMPWHLKSSHGCTAWHSLTWLCTRYCEIKTIRRYLLIHFVDRKFIWRPQHFYWTRP